MLGLEIEHPFWQAPLSGYSDLPMRRVARMHGASYTVNEVVLDRSLVNKSKWQERMLTVPPDDHPTGAQLMGADPADFGPAAKLLSDAGYDIIDINFGCPVRKVLSRCRGGYLLSDPETAVEIVSNVFDAVGGEKPVTVKMRLGLDDSAESERNFFSILESVFNLGAAAVTVHGRSVKQRYTGPSNWKFLAKVKRYAGDRIIIGSGDLFSAQDCVDMMNETGVDGVSIARGAIGNPWIFSECLSIAAGQPTPAPPSIEQQRDTIAVHFREAIDHYGEELGSKIMRKFGIKYSKLHPQARPVRDAFIAIKNAAGFQAVLGQWYDPTADWPPIIARPNRHQVHAAVTG